MHAGHLVDSLSVSGNTFFFSIITSIKMIFRAKTGSDSITEASDENINDGDRPDRTF